MENTEPMERLPNIHPGEILLEEFLKPLKMSVYRLAQETHMPETRIHAIIKGQRRVSADTALRLSRYFGTSAELWLGLQNHYDLEEVRLNNLADIERIQPRTTDAA
jgi:addiction module HigA family antidote